MSLPETIHWCKNHNSPALDGECWFWLTGQANGPCRIVTLPAAGPDDLVIRREDLVRFLHYVDGTASLVVHRGLDSEAEADLAEISRIARRWVKRLAAAEGGEG